MEKKSIMELMEEIVKQAEEMGRVSKMSNSEYLAYLNQQPVITYRKIWSESRGVVPIRESHNA